jgi:hypothetical protein
MAQKLKKTLFIAFVGMLLFTGLVAIPYAFLSTDVSLAWDYSGGCDCGNCSSGCTECSSGYSQGAYAPYGQSGYYSQPTYYAQPTYYLQGGYWPPINDITLNVTPKVVRIGEQATIVWNGGNASACTVTGGGINSTAISGSQAITVNGEVVIEAQCNLGPNISRASTTIKVLPRIQES